MVYPLRMSAAALLLAASLSAPAAAQSRPHPALAALVPLTDVYDARQTGLPGFDVAGIRCAALTMAQDIWSRANPFAGRVDPAALRAAELNLSGAEADRRLRLRLTAPRAAATTREDVLRVQSLYLQHFDGNARAGRHPWQGDTLVDRDATYCGFLDNRR
jgi:hypothetical protein